MIERQGCKVSIRRQCELLGITRSVLYYTRRGPSSWDLAVMRLIDEQYTRTPFYGVERMTAWLRRAGVVVGHNRVRRLMRLMGLEAIYPKPQVFNTDQGSQFTSGGRAGLVRCEGPAGLASAFVRGLRLR
jgi:putative transposase